MPIDAHLQILGFYLIDITPFIPYVFSFFI
jgi:hypothetical protein